jgi:DNA-binding transcriptional regulator YhcF (GntR family)
MRTITEASNQLGVSRKKIYNEVERLNIKTTKEGKNNYITDDDFERIKECITEQSTRKRIMDVLERDRNMTEGHISDREYMDLKERITFLEEQIKAKDNQINGLIQSTFNFSNLLQPGNEVAVTKEPKEKKSWLSRLFIKKNR